MSIFDDMATRYDSEERARVASIIADNMRAALPAGKALSGIDYGCGTGLVGLALAGSFASLLMVDASPNMVQVVQGKIAAAGLQNVQALCADFAPGTPAGLSADVVLAAQVLLHIPNTANILRRLRGVLNPGGLLLVADFDLVPEISHPQVHGGFVQADLCALAKTAGFASATAKTFYYGKNIFMNRDASLFLMQARA